MNHPEASVLSERKGPLAIATLNRPAVLNSLNLEMFQSLRSLLKAWTKDPSVGLIILRGAGQKGFCAGGDVKGLVLRLRESFDQAYARDFFVNEYSLDYAIHTCPKPVLVLGNGITMGGGIGLMAGASCRIVTETSVLAMPEISIGYFTDVGSSYFLNRMPGSIGLFLGLTSARMRASDSLFVGLADLFLPEAQISLVLAELENHSATDSCFSSRESLIQHIQGLGGKNYAQGEPSLFPKYLDQINALCSGDSILDVDRNLRNFHGELPWNFDPYFSGSPTSASLIFELLRKGKGLSLKACFDLELNLALACCQRKEIVEGVRSVLIDKDRNPLWDPPLLSQVDARKIAEYFMDRLEIQTE